MEYGLLAGEAPVRLLGTAEVPVSKALNPQLLGVLVQGSLLSRCVYFRPLCVYEKNVFPLRD